MPKHLKVKNRLAFIAILLLTILLIANSCKKKEAVVNPVVDPVFNVSSLEVSFTSKGGKSSLSLTSTDSWRIINPVNSWLQIDKASGNKGTTNIELIALQNSTGNTRAGELLISCDNGEERLVKVSQEGGIYMSYNTSPKAPDATGMGSNAAQLVEKINLGWNIGNTMEAAGGESGWGNPAITETYVKFVKQAGFNAIRIPCAWDMQHLRDRQKAEIDPAWLNRVKEVVGYCVKNDLYVILNIHWDGGWLEQNCTPAKKDSVNAKQKALWEQIASTLRDFDEHLMFASANEPNTETTAEMEVLLSYHRTFVNAVRSTGGKNTYRCLVIQGNYELISVDAFPKDDTPDRLIYEDHNYTPFQFTVLSEDADWGNMFYYWGEAHHSAIEPARNPTWGEESYQIAYFDDLKTKFVDKGIPVLMGEYGAYRRAGTSHVPLDLATHNAAIDYWITFMTKQALYRGIKPFFWDTGGILDRRNNKVIDQRTIDAIVAGSK